MGKKATPSAPKSVGKGSATLLKIDSNIGVIRILYSLSAFLMIRGTRSQSCCGRGCSCVSLCLGFESGAARDGQEPDVSLTAIACVVHCRASVLIEQYTYIYIYMSVHTYVYRNMSVDLYYVYIHIRAYIHTYIHTYVHTYIHTYIHTCRICGPLQNDWELSVLPETTHQSTATLCITYKLQQPMLKPGTKL